MSPDPIYFRRSDALAAHNDKRIHFNLCIADTSTFADGVGMLHVTDSHEPGMQQAMLDVTIWPQTLTGTVTIHQFYLNELETGWMIQSAAHSDSEIQCID